MPLTPSEALVLELRQRSFLSLWSIANPRGKKKGEVSIEFPVGERRFKVLDLVTLPEQLEVEESQVSSRPLPTRCLVSRGGADPLVGTINDWGPLLPLCRKRHTLLCRLRYSHRENT